MQSLRQAERALLIPEGLPNRPWFHHAIYAPGQYTGYAAVVIPGVNEAIDKHDLERTRQQISVLAAALDRAAKVLEGVSLMTPGQRRRADSEDPAFRRCGDVSRVISDRESVRRRTVVFRAYGRFPAKASATAPP